MSLDTLEPATAVAEKVVQLWPGAPPEPTACGPGPEQTFRQGVPDGRETTMLRNVADADPDRVPARRRPRRTGSASSSRPAAAGASWPGSMRAPSWPRWLTARGYTAFLLKYRLMATRPIRATSRASRRRPASRSPRASRRRGRRSRSTTSSRTRGDGGAERRQQRRAPSAGPGPRTGGGVERQAGPRRHDRLLGRRLRDRRRGDGPGRGAARLRRADLWRTAGGRPVPSDAPPLFSAVTEDDRLLLRSVQQLYLDWSKAGRPAELHVFARGGHGFGMARQGLPVDRWVDLFGDWLADRGSA